VRRTDKPLIRTAVAADLPELQRVFRTASLSNADDAPLLLARPEFLVFAGDGIQAGMTRVVVDASAPDGQVLGFATVVTDDQGEPDLEDLFVDPPCQRRGIASELVLDAVRTAREAGRAHLFVTANPHALAFYTSVGFVDVGPATTELGAGRRMRRDTSLD
jgi:ribosomal protein S18 acetylase RimI-like enzyme